MAGHLLASSGEGAMPCEVSQRSGGFGGPMRRRTTGNVLRRQFASGVPAVGIASDLPTLIRYDRGKAINKTKTRTEQVICA